MTCLLHSEIRVAVVFLLENPIPTCTHTTHTCTHSHMHAHSRTYTHSLSHTHIHTLSLSHTHTHTHSLSLSLTHTHTHRLPPSFLRRPESSPRSRSKRPSPSSCSVCADSPPQPPGSLPVRMWSSSDGVGGERVPRLPQSGTPR